MPKQNLDGIYKLSMALETEEDFGPPKPGIEEDLDDIEFEEVGHFQISGDSVTAVGDNEHVEELIASTFRREGKKKGDVYIDSHVPMENGEPGFSAVFLNFLNFLDYEYQKEE